MRPDRPRTWNRAASCAFWAVLMGTACISHATTPSQCAPGKNANMCNVFLCSSRSAQAVEI